MNIELDDRFLKEGLKLTHLKTKKELVKRLKRKKILELEEKVSE